MVFGCACDIECCTCVLCVAGMEAGLPAPWFLSGKSEADTVYADTKHRLSDSQLCRYFCWPGKWVPNALDCQVPMQGCRLQYCHKRHWRNNLRICAGTSAGMEDGCSAHGLLLTTGVRARHALVTRQRHQGRLQGLYCCFGYRASASMSGTGTKITVLATCLPAVMKYCLHLMNCAWRVLSCAGTVQVCIARASACVQVYLQSL